MEYALSVSSLACKSLTTKPSVIATVTAIKRASTPLSTRSVNADSGGQERFICTVLGWQQGIHRLSLCDVRSPSVAGCRNGPVTRANFGAYLKCMGKGLLTVHKAIGHAHFCLQDTLQIIQVPSPCYRQQGHIRMSIWFLENPPAVHI